MTNEALPKKSFPWAAIVGALLGSIVGSFILWRNGILAAMPLLGLCPVVAFLIVLVVVYFGWKLRLNRANRGP